MTPNPIQLKDTTKMLEDLQKDIIRGAYIDREAQQALSQAIQILKRINEKVLIGIINPLDSQIVHYSRDSVKDLARVILTTLTKGD